MLGKILEFDGSLAFYHKAYNSIVGYESPLPSDRRLYTHSRGTRSNVLVNKKWQSMVMGTDGLQKWKCQSEEKIKKDISIAIKASTDESLSWTARICAMAIANDVEGLKRVFETSDEFNKALWEQENKDDDSYSQYDDSFEPSIGYAAIIEWLKKMMIHIMYSSYPLHMQPPWWVVLRLSCICSHLQEGHFV